MNEYTVVAIAMVCMTIAGIAKINHGECLTGHDIDAKIQQSFNNNPKGEK